MFIAVLFEIAPNWKQPQMSINRKWNTHIAVFPYKESLLSNKKHVDHAVTDEFQNNYAEWKKPDKEEYILYDSII